MLQLAIELHARMQSELSKSKQAMLMLSRMRAVVVCAECGAEAGTGLYKTTKREELQTKLELKYNS